MFNTTTLNQRHGFISQPVNMAPCRERRLAALEELEAAISGHDMDRIGRALRAYYGMAGFRPMADPVGDRRFLDWVAIVFEVDPVLVEDAFYDCDTKSGVA